MPPTPGPQKVWSQGERQHTETESLNIWQPTRSKSSRPKRSFVVRVARSQQWQHLPLSLPRQKPSLSLGPEGKKPRGRKKQRRSLDRKSTRLNSSHLGISYAVFCL